MPQSVRPKFDGATEQPTARVCTGVCIRRALEARMAHVTRIAKQSRLGYAGRSGRTWDQTILQMRNFRSLRSARGSALGTR
jgi:hypothetical protein